MTSTSIGVNGFQPPTHFTVDEKRPLLQVVDPQGQIARFNALDGIIDPSIGEAIKGCDQYFSSGFPTNKGRIYLQDQTPTNGAFIWDKLILIQGPHNLVQLGSLFRIAAEKQAGAIVRLGPIVGYLHYPDDIKLNEPLAYPSITIQFAANADAQPLFDTTTRTAYRLTSDESSHEVLSYAVEGWRDHQSTQCEEIYRLLQALEEVEGPLIIHCRGGFGRTGTFAACWKAYQQFKTAQEEGRSVEIDPAGIVEEIRQFRTNMVEKGDQFLMLLDFVAYLNALN